MNLQDDKSLTPANSDAVVAAASAASLQMSEKSPAKNTRNKFKSETHSTAPPHANAVASSTALTNPLSEYI